MFSPEVNGKIRWTSQSTLVFTPIDPLPASTKFSVSLNQNHVDQHNRVSKWQKPIEFHTPFFAIQNVHYLWKLSNTGEQVLAAHLQLNNEVSSADLSAHLTLLLDGQEQQIHSLTSVDAKNYQFEIPSDVKAKRIRIVIRKGLQFNYTDWILNQDIEHVQFVPKIDQLELVDLETHHDGAEGSLILWFNQELEEATVRKNISIEPETKFTLKTDGERVEILGTEFNSNTTYTVKINNLIKSSLSATLAQSIDRTVSFGTVQPLLEWVDPQGLYVSAQGQRSIGAKIIGYDEINYKVYKVFANNIVHNVRHSYWDEGLVLWNSISDIGELVHDEIIQVKHLKRSSDNRFVNFDFDDQFDDYQGIYYVVLEVNTDEYWDRIEQFISLSDIGLICKEGEDNVFVFANSIQTTQPIANVEVQFINQKNQVVGTAQTNSNGVSKWQKASSTYPDFEVSMITARKQDDFNMLMFHNGLIERSRYESGGIRTNPGGFDVYLFGDRDIYRPGEEIKIAGIIRHIKSKTAVPDFPFILECLLPNGRVFESRKVVTDAYGHFDASIPVSSSGATGRYQCVLRTNAQTFLESRTVLVEEFMPDRIACSIRSGSTVIHRR